VEAGVWVMSGKTRKMEKYMNIKPALVIAAVATLAGCVGPLPQNPQEFRHQAANGRFGKAHETYQVDGAYREVATRIKEKTGECLNRVVRMQSCRGTSCQTMDFHLHPHFHSGSNGSEFDLQVDVMPKSAINVGGTPPKGGAYAAVVDITPVAGHRSKLAVYSVDIGFYKHIPIAIRHWADGSNLCCPDLTADM